MSLLEMFCEIDDFWQEFKPWWESQLVAESSRHRRRESNLTMSEIMVIMVMFHQSGYRTFKGFYIHHVCQHLQSAFPDLVSYNRFVELQQRCLVPLTCFLQGCCRPSRGIAFIDSTALAVCHNRRIQAHRVFDGVAQRGKTSLGWFYGFKVHLIITDQGELVAFAITPGNVDDRKPVKRLARDITGKLFGDKGYISKKLMEDLLQDNIDLITTTRRNMKPRVLSLIDKALLRKRSLIETVNDQLKNISQIEHTRHRCLQNFFVNLIAGLLAYTYQPTKPALNFTEAEKTLLGAG